MADLLDLDLALPQMLHALQPLPSFEATPRDAAGCHLAEDVLAAHAVPPFANSAMDGYAVCSEDPELLRGAPLRIAQRIFAGAAPGAPITAGHCARIFTGAPLPAGADAVIAQEDATVQDHDQVMFRERPAAGACVRRAGDDVREGQQIAAAGDSMNAARIALLTAAGVEHVRVHRAPNVAVIVTGDELRTPGQALEPGTIHDSNRPMLEALVRRVGGAVVHSQQVGDDPGLLREALRAAAAAGDAVICSGGVSVGDADHVRDLLAEAGEVAFWRLALKPGKPFAFGTLHGRPFFGLPGNPVSTLVTFLLLVKPALLRMAGASDLTTPSMVATLATEVRKRPGRRDFQRGRFETTAEGEVRVHAFERQDSNLLGVMAAANCLIDLPRDNGDVAAGSRVRIIPLTGAL